MCAKRTIVVSALILMLSVVEAYPQTRTTRSFATVDDTLITLDFNKGTLDEYVQAVTEAKKGKVTIIIDSDLEDIEVPPAHLRNVSLAQALEWIPKTSTSRQQGLTLQIMPRPGRTDEDSSMFLFTTLPLAVPTGTSRDDTQVKTFALNWATDSTNPELVKTAVQDALSTRGLTASKPVAYNPQTGILTLRGTSRDVTIASQVMNELKQAQQQAKIIEQLQTELDALKDKVTELQGAGDRRSK
jgi:hypothetical protein